MIVARILAAKGRDVVTTQPYRTLAEAAALLTARNIGAAVVTDAQGRVLGCFRNATSFMRLAWAARPR